MAVAAARTRWWWSQRRRLAEMAPATTPLYVYSLPVVKERLAHLKTSLTSLDRIFYAVKANEAPEILKEVAAAGMGFECVSMAEIQHVLSVFPDLAPSRILFTPNFAPRAEYEFALKVGVHLTVDNYACFDAWPELFAGATVALRVDPGKGRGHHAHVKTAGVASKFGIGLDDMAACAAACKRHQVIVGGLHAHSGSGILDETGAWANHAHILAEVAQEHFPTVKFLDIGGGLGIPYRFSESAIDLRKVESTLAPVKEAIPHLELWMEPGRFIAAECGVLLTRVTQVKQKCGTTFVGVNCGMNSIMRPALYDSYHALVSLDCEHEPNDGEPCDSDRWMSVTVVGPICESADVFGRLRSLPCDVKEDDPILIDSVGAYGRCMASSYNRRPEGDEVFLRD